MPNKEIAKHLGISKSTVEYRWRKLKQGKTVYHDSPKKGRPRALQGDDYEHFMKAVDERDWEDVQELLSQADSAISASTARRYLKEEGWISQRKVRVPLIQPRHAQARLEWARAHRHHSLWFWRRVWFSDESKFAELPRTSADFTGVGRRRRRRHGSTPETRGNTHREAVDR